MRSLIKHLSIFFLLAFMALPAFGQEQSPLSGSEPSRSDSTGRKRTDLFFAVRNFVSTPASCTVVTSSATAATTTAITATQRRNVNGYLFGYAPGASITGQTRTTSIASMSHSSKIQIGISDVSTGSVPVCQRFIVCGELWNGKQYCEDRTTPINETTWVTTYASFMSVNRIRISSCAGFDASDVFFARQTSEVALDYRIGTAPGTVDVESVCVAAPTASGTINLGQCFPGSLFSYDTSILANTIQLRDTDVGFTGSASCVPDYSTFFVRYRANPNARAR